MSGRLLLDRFWSRVNLDGHEYDVITPQGERRCKTCHVDTQRRYVARKKAAQATKGGD